MSRHHYDNRLAVQMLNRLDRYADASDRTAPGHAARLVAGDFDAYLDMVGVDGGPARAGLFMLARGADGEGPAAELEPVIALARADRHLRCGALAVDVADLDPAARADWTAEQWARAEASGVVVLAPAPEPVPEPAPAPDPAPAPAAVTHQPVSTSLWSLPPDEPVWWDEDAKDWRTHFPPPADFLGEEEGEYGDLDYGRELDDRERALVEAVEGNPEEVRLAEDEAERDRWFAAYAAPAADTPAPPPAAAPPAAAPPATDPQRRDDAPAPDAAAPNPSATGPGPAPTPEHVAHPPVGPGIDDHE